MIYYRKEFQMMEAENVRYQICKREPGDCKTEYQK